MYRIAFVLLEDVADGSIHHELKCEDSAEPALFEIVPKNGGVSVLRKGVEPDASAHALLYVAPPVLKLTSLGDEIAVEPPDVTQTSWRQAPNELFKIASGDSIFLRLGDVIYVEELSLSSSLQVSHIRLKVMPPPSLEIQVGSSIPSHPLEIPQHDHTGMTTLSEHTVGPASVQVIESIDEEATPSTPQPAASKNIVKETPTTIRTRNALTDMSAPRGLSPVELGGMETTEKYSRNDTQVKDEDMTQQQTPARSSTISPTPLPSPSPSKRLFDDVAQETVADSSIHPTGEKQADVRPESAVPPSSRQEEPFADASIADTSELLSGTATSAGSENVAPHFSTAEANLGDDIDAEADVVPLEHIEEQDLRTGAPSASAMHQNNETDIDLDEAYTTTFNNATTEHQVSSLEVIQKNSLDKTASIIKEKPETPVSSPPDATESPLKKAPSSVLRNSRKRKEGHTETENVGTTNKRTKTISKLGSQDQKASKHSRSSNVAVVVVSTATPLRRISPRLASRTSTNNSVTKGKSRSASAKSRRASASTNSTLGSPKPYSGMAPRIVFSNSTLTPTSAAMKFLRANGGKTVEKTTAKSFDILVVGNGELKKTSKFLTSIALGKPVVTESWLSRSAIEEKFLDTGDFIPQDPFREAQWGLKLSEVVGKDRSKLLEGMSIFITPALKKDYGSGYREIEELAKVAGVQDVMSKLVSGVESGTIVLALPDEGDDVATSLMKQGTVCYNKKLLSVSILRGKLDLESDEFKIAPSSSAAPRKRGRPRKSGG